MRSQWAYPGEVYEAIRQYHRNLDEEVQFLVDLGVSAGTRVLDLGCGTGTLLRGLALKGARGRGIDVSDSFLMEANSRKSREELHSVEFEKGNIYGIEERGEYDFVVCVFNTISHLKSIAEIVRTIRDIRNLTSSKGKFVIEFPFYLNFVERFQKDMKIYIDQDEMSIIREISHSIDAYLGKWIHREDITVVKRTGIERYFEKYDQTVILPAQMSRILKECGFNALEFYADWRAGRVIEDNSTCIVVAS